MKKADYKFHKDRKDQIQRNSQQNEPMRFWCAASNQPIYIPKRKKKK